jgi:hypothetical protein
MNLNLSASTSLFILLFIIQDAPSNEIKRSKVVPVHAKTYGGMEE